MCWHRWTKWGKPFNALKPGSNYRSVTRQERSCKKCNVIQLRTLQEGNVAKEINQSLKDYYR